MLPLQFPTVLRLCSVSARKASVFTRPAPSLHSLLSTSLGGGCSSAHDYSSSGSFPLVHFRANSRKPSTSEWAQTLPPPPLPENPASWQERGVCPADALTLHNLGGSTFGRIWTEEIDLLNIVCPILRVLYLFPAIREFCKEKKRQKNWVKCQIPKQKERTCQGVNWHFWEIESWGLTFQEQQLESEWLQDPQRCLKPRIVPEPIHTSWFKKSEKVT